MKIFVRLLALVLSVIVILSFTACKKNDEKDGNGSMKDETQSIFASLNDDSSVDAGSEDWLSDTDKELTGGDEISDTSSDVQNDVSENVSSSKKDDYSKLIVGKWSGDQNITDYLRAEGYEPLSQVIITKYLEFSNEGVLYHSVDETAFYKAVMPIVAAKVNEDIDENYKDKKDFEIKNDKSVSDYIDETVSMFSSWLCYECEYSFDGDKLYITEHGGGETSVLSEYYFEDNDNLFVEQNGIKYYLTRK